MKKKIVNILFIIIGLFLVASCEMIVEPATYKIVYYLNGEQIDLEPSSYKEGETFKLPEPTSEIKENEEFDGWYLNSNCTGEIVEEIKTTDNENKILFGKTIEKEIDDLEPPVVETDLKTILNIDNYTYTYSEVDQTYDYSEEYKVTTNAISNTYEDIYGDMATNYLQEVNGELRFIYQYENVWYYTKEGDEYFEAYYPYLMIVYVDTINADHFAYDSSKSLYTVKEQYLQDDVESLIGSYDGEVFKSFEIYAKDNTLDKIIITSDYDDGTEILGITYTITFSNINNTVVNVPKSIYDLGEDAKLTTDIIDVYDMEVDDEVTIEGTITGIYGNNFYLNDGTKGILVYFGSDTTFVSMVEEGENLIVSGTIALYKGIYQIQNVSAVSYSSNVFDVESVYITDFSQDSVQQYANDLVEVENAKIVSYPTNFNTSSDNSFVISYNDIEIDVFISKHVSNSIKTTILNKVSSLGVGSLINIENLHVSKYNEYQFVVTNQTVAKDGFVGEVKQTGIVVEDDILTFIVGVEEDEILGTVNVYAVYNNDTRKQLTVSEYVVTSDFVENEIGLYVFTFTSGEFTYDILVDVIDEEDALIKPVLNNPPLYDVLDRMAYDSSTGETYGVTKGLPSIGNPQVLVIPVEFTDAPAPTKMVDDLEKAFFGTSNETGWESLQSYYYKSSYGKLTIEGTVLEPFNTGKTVAYYNQLQNEYNDALDAYLNYETDIYPDSVEYSIIKSALEYYDSQINYADYDTDNDGYIDSIYLVYTTDYNDTDDNSLWWAFTNEYYTEDIELYDNVEADFYVFMSYNFLFDELQGKKVTYNAETIIHETGHLLGLDDYYDYDSTEGPAGGIGGGDMMDYNVGDHNAYSKLLLGWITPYIATSTTVTLDLNSFVESGECVMICKNWNGSIFTEFFIIDFFTPTLLNEVGKGSSGLFSISGIRIYHVDATLNNPEDCFSVFEITKYNNSYTSHRLITLVEADGRNDIDDNGYSEDSDLFQVSDIYSNAKWYDNTKANFSVIVNSINEDSANITIKF